MSRRPIAFLSVSSWLRKTVGRCTPHLWESVNTQWFLCVLGALLSFGVFARGQVNPGTPSWSAYDSHAVDSINLQNLNIVVNLPLYHKAGAFPFQSSLNGESYTFKATDGSSSTWYNSFIISTNWPTLLVPGILNAAYFTSGVYELCPDGVHYTNTYTNWVIWTLDGTYHWLPTTDYTDLRTDGSGLSCYNKTFTDQVVDGTGYTMVATQDSASVYDRSGKQLTTDSVTDANGNVITDVGATITDTLGLTVMSGLTGPRNSNFEWTDVNGGSPKVTMTPTGSLALKTAFGCTGVGEYNDSGTLPKKYNYPDGTSIAFTYEGTPGNTGYYTGRLGSITLRSGGVITYGYAGSNNGLNCTYQVPPTLTRTTSDGTTTYTWAAKNNGSGNWGNTTTVVDPGGNEKVYTFTGLTATGNAALPITQALTEVQTFQNTGTVGSPTYSTTATTTDFTCYNATAYNSTPSNCATASVSLPIVSTWVYHEVGGSKPSLQETKFDKYGDVTYSAQFDFGATTPTFQTTITYGSWNGSSCTAWTGNVQNKPCEIERQDGSGNKLADSRMAYNSTGNLLSTSVFNGSIYIGQSSNNTYNSNGTPLTMFDLANNETDYSYSSGGYVCVGGSCPGEMNLVFPTTITNKTTTLATNFTWNATGGVKLTEVGPNGAANQTTTYSYDGNCESTADPFWRVGCVTDPLLNAHGVSFLDSSDEVQTWFSFNSGNSAINTTSTVDGYGRSIDLQKETGPSTSNYDTTSTGYSWPSAYFQIFNSMPCGTTSLGSGCGTTYGVTTLYDVLNRPTTITESGSNGVTTNTYYPPASSATRVDVRTARGPAPTWDGETAKQVQKEFDGLGRLTISCGILSSGGTSCGEANTASGIETSYTYTTAAGRYEVQATRGSQTKTIYTDSLGRVTQSTTPDTGTWNYYYDSTTTGVTCPTGYKGVVGKLEASRDPNGNLICYAYDSLGRVTGINANGTTCRHFYYDTTYGTVPSGVTTPTYTLGRLAEASTDNCSGALITDEWFSYDKDGNKTDLWETTPNAGRYYHAIATFAGNGAVLSVQLKNPSEYTNTYTLDGEGRWTSLVNSHVPQTQVSSVAYNAASQPTQVNIGSGTDNDAYTYDPNTGRMTQYVFTVGSANETGVLTWNPIGSLKTLAITDGFHSGGTQTCNMGSSTPSMGYDDMNRLLMFDCGTSGWADLQL
jgi:YD repeat-containing protein